MIKKIIYMAVVIFIVLGAAYSYNKVNFGQKTAMLFKAASNNNEGMRGAPGGGPPQGDPPVMGATGKSQSRFGYGSDRRNTGRSQQPQPGFRPDIQQGAGRGAGQPGNARGGQPRGRRSISLENVIPYAFILVFFALLTRFVELIIRQEFGTKFTDWICLKS